MDLKIVSLQGGTPKKLVVSETNFGREYNEALVHQVVTAYMAGSRQGTKAQKTRSAVSGGGAKPFRQKGTGNARAGTTRSPLWRTGGVIFAAVPRDYSQKVNKKMYRGALKCILSELVRQDRLVVVEKLELQTVKTKELVAQLKALDLTGVLIISDNIDEKLYLASRNIKNVSLYDVSAIDPVSMVRHQKVLITVGALKQLEEMLG